MIRQEKKPLIKTINIYLSVMVGILSLANLFFSASLSSSGEKLRDLETISRQLRHENQLLEQKVVTDQSLTKLYEKSHELGFTQKPDSLTLSPDEAVAHIIE